MAIPEFKSAVIGPAPSERDPSARLLPAPAGGWRPSRRFVSYSQLSVFSFAVPLSTEKPGTAKSTLRAQA